MDPYLLVLIGGYFVAYVMLLRAFGFLFGSSGRQIKLGHFAIILVMLVATLALAMLIPYEALANRVMHALMGGFTASIMVFLAIRASGLRLARPQLLVLIALIVTALGVANELAEAVLQWNGYPEAFAPTVSDTWYDLYANTTGILLALVVIALLSRRRRAYLHSRS